MRRPRRSESASRGGGLLRTPGSCMKFKAALLVALLLPGAFGAGRAQPAAADAFEQNRKLGRGVNILGYDPIWRSMEKARFQAKHFQLLKEAGFNSVRINLAPFRRMNA